MPWYDSQGKIEIIVPGEQSKVFRTARVAWLVPGDPASPARLLPLATIISDLARVSHIRRPSKMESGKDSA
jgi:hypothetical protein